MDLCSLMRRFLALLFYILFHLFSPSIHTFNRLRIQTSDIFLGLIDLGQDKIVCITLLQRS